MAYVYLACVRYLPVLARLWVPLWERFSAFLRSEDLKRLPRAFSSDNRLCSRLSRRCQDKRDKRDRLSLRREEMQTFAANNYCYNLERSALEYCYNVILSALVTRR